MKGSGEWRLFVGVIRIDTARECAWVFDLIGSFEGPIAVRGLLSNESSDGRWSAWGLDGWGGLALRGESAIE